MKRLHLSICVVLLGILLSSCQVFPYAYESTVETPVETIASTTTPQPTSTQTLATASPEDIGTEEATDAPEELTPGPTAETIILYTVQEGNPTYISNFANPDEGCDWMGIAGQVFDQNGNEVLDLTIVSGNILEENSVELSSLTGTATAYGPGGYEIKLSDIALDTNQTFWIEVRSAEGIVLSEKVFFDTYADCEKNLILINFVQLSEEAKAQPASEATPTPEAYP